MSFIDTLRAHLGEYKRQGLGISEPGLIEHRGRTLKKHHVLPLKQAQLNILEPYRSAFLESAHSRFELHRQFHHLNSSQALSINLFYPLIAEDRLDLLLKSLALPAPTGTGWTAAFEKPSPIEATKHRTTFDFHMHHADAGEIYFEVKYTELEFGKARHDAEHQKKFRATWLPMVSSSPYLNECCLDEAFFLDHYQLLRLFAHLSDTARVVLVLPSANRDIALQAQKACETLLTDAGRERVGILYLEDLVADLERESAGGALSHYYEQFRAKYLPGPR